MNLEFTPVPDLVPTGSVRLVDAAGAVGLYRSDTEPVPASTPSGTGFRTILTSTAVPGGGTASPSTLQVLTRLPTPPQWALIQPKTGEGTLATTVFGGAWNSLIVADYQQSTLTERYSYTLEDTQDPAFVLNTGTKAAEQPLISALFSGYQLGVIGLQDQDGKQVPAVSGLVGTSDDPVATGRVFGDLQNGLPSTVTAVYLKTRAVGPLAPSGFPSGALSLAQIDVSSGTPGTPTPLLDGLALSDFDMAVADGTIALFGITGEGAPLLALFDTSGNPLGSPNLPVGSWSNPGRWAASPTVVPHASAKGETGFALAFVEMDGQSPVAIQVGMLTAPQ